MFKNSKMDNLLILKIQAINPKNKEKKNRTKKMLDTLMSMGLPGMLSPK